MATVINESGLKVTYTDTGAKEGYIIPRITASGRESKATLAVVGGSTSDVYNVQEKLGGSDGDFVDNLESIDGIVQPIAITGFQEEIRLNITTNTSGSITLYVSFG